LDHNDLTGQRMTNHQAAAEVENPRRPSSESPHPHDRTGVRFVLTNVTDPSHTDDYSAWYDEYETAIIRPGVLANAFRFENPDAAGTETDPRYAAIYDLVTRDPAWAWPATENSPDYPTHLFADPRSKLVSPALRGSYALTGSMKAVNDRRALTGVHIILSDGGNDAVREQRAAAVLDTGFFHATSRFRIIEGSPEPPAWLEVFETGLRDPLSAYARACDGLALRPRADSVRQRSSRSFALVAAHQADPQAGDWSALCRQSL
jgi:hypothetical protein